MLKNNEVNTYYAQDRYASRNWLKNYSDSFQAVWLVYYKKYTKVPCVSYMEVVDEALCFGWIDSKVKSIDNNRYMQFFCARKPKSTWS